ncbi:hypothetical protein NN484_09745 [Pseudomonas serboccidentalis]|uniref:Uncharacterized protein n=1 Tax=Pseudomonas serboccidentalis TaxID=2964670 RepID=A0ABY7ZE27_9PSED|nr:hypothetical protein [Pseudomonas serboccidentalis]WDR37996.1 hypothetical protein NN484_09745 [Pseudomonas serboccidentalis]
MDPLYIEDTDNWIGCPTPLESCRHQLQICKSEIQEQTIDARSKADDASRRATDIEIKSNWELMAKDRQISHFSTAIKKLKGAPPFAPSFPHQCDNF